MFRELEGVTICAKTVVLNCPKVISVCRPAPYRFKAMGIQIQERTHSKALPPNRSLFINSGNANSQRTIGFVRASHVKETAVNKLPNVAALIA